MIYCTFRRHDESPKRYVAGTFQDLADQLNADGRTGFALKVYWSSWVPHVVGRIWHDGVAIGWVEGDGLERSFSLPDTTNADKVDT